MAEPIKKDYKIKIPGSVIFFAVIAIFGLMYFASRRLTQREPDNAKVNTNMPTNSQNLNQNTNQNLLNANRDNNFNINNKNENSNSR